MNIYLFLISLFITNFVLGQHQGYANDKGVTYTIVSTEYFDKEHNWSVKVLDGGFSSISILPDEKNQYALLLLDSKVLKGMFKTVSTNSIGYEAIIDNDDLFSRKNKNQKGVDIFINEKKREIRLWYYKAQGKKIIYNLKYSAKEKYQLN